MKRTILLLHSMLALVATAIGAQQLRLSTENDIFTNDDARDDLYTFSVGVEVERAGFTFSLRENAFTDRAAGLRFDETFLSVGRPLPGVGGWNLYAEAGLALRGHGLFGESAQNAVHRAIGDDQVHLEYTGSSRHPRLALTADRRVATGPGFDWGPRLELDLVPGLRSWAMVGAEGTWRPNQRLEVGVLAGARFIDGSYEPLARHLESSAPAVRIGVVFDDRFFLSWSYNDYGDAREHLSAGVRVPLIGRSGDGLRR